MKSIQETIRAKELEFLKAVDDALQQRELELRQLQNTLMEALRVVNALLDESAAKPTAEITPVNERLTSQAAASAAVAGKSAVGWEQPVKRFP